MPFEVALNPQAVQAFIASVASVMAATKTWLELRDRRAAKNAAVVAHSRALTSPQTIASAQSLVAVIPSKVLEGLVSRFNRCYEKLGKMLDDEEADEGFAGEVDIAAKKALPKCVCNALATIKAVTGSLDHPALQEAWRVYGCEKRLGEK